MNSIDFSTQSINKNFSFHLPLEEIHVWVIHLNKKSNLDFSWSQKKLDTSQTCLRYLLSRYLEISPELFAITKTERGKPILSEHPEISFSIAHSGDLLALAFARHPVGIDLEGIRPVKAMALAKKFFLPHEIEFLAKAPKERFFYLWTAKEAALKADGCGITQGLRQAVTVIQEDSLAGLHLKGKFISVTPWFLEATSESYTGAIASFISPSLIRWYDWRTADNVDN